MLENFLLLHDENHYFFLHGEWSLSKGKNTMYINNA